MFVVTLVLSFSAAGSAVAAIAPSGEVGPQSTGATVMLPAAAAVGQSATVSMAIDHVTSGAAGDGTLAVRLGITREVAAVNAATGTYSTRSVIQSLDVAQAPAGFDVAPLDSIEGASIQQSFSSTGAVASAASVEDAASPSELAGGQQLASWLASTSIGFPAEPVAVGASWTTPGRAPVGSTSVAVVYQCRLASVTASEYTVEISYAENFSTASATGGQIDGTVSGRGTMTGALDNPLVVDGHLNQVVEGMASGGGAVGQFSDTAAIITQASG